MIRARCNPAGTLNKSAILSLEKKVYFLFIRKNILKLLLLFLILFGLERLYLLPIYIPTNSKPKTKRTAAYLGKTVCKHADFAYGMDVLELAECIDSYTYYCEINDSSFSVNMYMTKSEKNIALKKLRKSTDKYISYFKQGAYYIVCENPNLGNSKYNKPSFPGKKYYDTFPGEDIIYTNDEITKTITKKDSHHVHTK